MRLIEVLVEGVPSVPGVLRYPIQPGFNPWKQKGVFPLAQFVEVVGDLFYPSLRQDVPLGPGKAKRTGLTFEARDQIYRIVRDYPKKKVFLSRLERGTKDTFREISAETRFIVETLNRSAQVPPRDVFFGLWVSRPGRPQDNSTEPRTPASAPEGNTSARLALLRKEEASLRQIHELENRVDELQTRIFQIQEQLRKLEAPREALTKALAEYESYTRFDREGLVTPGILEKLKAYPAQIEKRGQDLQSLEEKAKELTDSLTATPDRPFWQEPVLFTGGAVGLIGFAAAALQPNWLFLWLGVGLAGLLSVIVGMMLGQRRLERVTKMRKQLRGLDNEKAGLEKRFEAETLPLRKFFEEVETNDIEEIESLLARREELAHAKRDAEAEWATVTNDVSEEKLEREKTEIERQIALMDGQLAELPPVSMDPNAIEREIRELEALVSDDHGLKESDSPGPGVAEDVNALLKILASATGETPSALLAKTQKGIAANAAAASSNRFVGVETKGGRIVGFKGADGRSLSWGAADEETKTTLLFAVQFTCWQYLSALTPSPFFLDVASFPPGEPLLKVTIAAARHLSKRAQVILISA